MNELQQVLNSIKQDKNTNLLPGNLRDNVTCLGVEGTAEVPEPIYTTTDYRTVNIPSPSSKYTKIYHLYRLDDYLIVSWKSGSYGSNYYLYKKDTNGYTLLGDTNCGSSSPYSGYAVIIGYNDKYVYVIQAQTNSDYCYIHPFNLDTNMAESTISEYQSTSISDFVYSQKDGYAISSRVGSGYLFKLNMNENPVTLDRLIQIPNNSYVYNKHQLIFGYSHGLTKVNISDSSTVTTKIMDKRIYGVNYYGTKVFFEDGIYQLSEQLTVSQKLGDINIPTTSTQPIYPLNEKYYVRYNTTDDKATIYEFNEDTNLFTELETVNSGDISGYSQSPDLYYGNYVYDFIQGDTLIGYTVDGNNLYINADRSITTSSILNGYQAYNAQGSPIVGTMPNNGELNITPTTENQNIPEGYTSGGTVLGDENLKSENIKKDVSIFGVTGSLESSSGGVKLFETEEEMQADSTAKEGDLAVVYREEIQNMTADTQTQFITFPETVILPEAFTGDVYCMLRAVDETVMFDGQVMLNQSMFDFNGYTDAGMIRVRYISSDGITYNRDEFMGDSGNLTNPVDFGTTIQVYMSEEWNDSMGYFMQIGGSTFDGLYEYTSKTDTTRIDMMQNIRHDDSNELVYDAVPIEVDTLSTIIQAARTSISTNVTNYVLTNATYHNALIEKLSDTEYNVYFRAYLSSSKIVLSYCGLFEQDEAYYLADYPNGWFNTTVGTLSNSTESTTPRVYAMLKINVNFSTGVSTYTELPASDFTQTSIAGYTHAKYNKAFDANSTLVDVRYIVDSRTVTNDGSMHVTNSSNNGEYISTKYTTMYIYVIAPTQYTLTSSNQLLPNISAYGKNGNVIGDDSIYNNIPKQDYLDKLCNINAVEGTGQYTTTLQTGAILQPNKLYGCNLADTIDNTNMTIAKNTIISQIGNYSDSLKTIKSLYGVNYIVRDNYVYYLSLESDNVVIYKLDKKLNTVERHAFSDAFSDAQLEPYVAMDVVDNIMYISSNLGTTWQIIACDISNDTSSVIYSGSLSYSPYNDIRIKVSNGHIYLFHAETYVSISSQNKSKLYIKECDILGNNMKTLFSYTPGINVDQFAITSDDKYVIITDIDGETGYIFDIDAKSCSKLSFVGKPQKLCVLPIDDTFIYMIGDTDIYKININDTTVTQASISNEILTKMRFTYYINGKWYTDLNSELYNVNIISDASTKLSMSWFANDYLPNKDDSETRFSRVQLQQSYDVIQSNNIVDIYALSASSKTKGVIKLSLLNLTLDKIDIWNLPKMIIAGSTNDNIPVVLCDNLASLSQAEYNIALDTTEQILGKGKM